jgi:hypothetical protein
LIAQAALWAKISIYPVRTYPPSQIWAIRAQTRLARVLADEIEKKRYGNNNPISRVYETSEAALALENTCCSGQR